jgi:hypothetical protein
MMFIDIKDDYAYGTMSEEDLRDKLRQVTMFVLRDRVIEDANIHKKYCTGLLTRG